MQQKRLKKRGKEGNNARKERNGRVWISLEVPFPRCVSSCLERILGTK